MSQEKFMRFLLIGLATAFGTADLLLLMNGMTQLALLATLPIVLVVSLAGLYLIRAGGYFISEEKIRDTLREMRG